MGSDTWSPDGPEPPDAAARDAERYRWLGPLGAGGMGAVDRVLDQRLGREVARKTLSRDGAGRRARFLREAEIGAQLEHPNVVPVYDLTEGPDGPELWMQLVRGHTLAEAVAAGELPSRAERLHVFLKVCEAVAYAHSHGVIHLDLKPENVMVGAFGEVLVTDWGLARRLGTDGAGEEGPVGGTPGWMAPEQARGGALTAAADQYALGRLLAWMVGDVPPRELRQLVERATAERPEERLPDVSVLRDELVRFLGDEDLRTVRYTPADRAGRWLRRRWRLVTGAAVLGLALGVAVVSAAAARDSLRAAALTRYEREVALARLAGGEDPLQEQLHFDRAAEAAASIGHPATEVRAGRALAALRSPSPVARIHLPAEPSQVVLRGDRVVAVTPGDAWVLALPDLRPVARGPLAAGAVVGAGFVDGRPAVATLAGGHVTVSSLPEGAELASFAVTEPDPARLLFVYGDRREVGIELGDDRLHTHRYRFDGERVTDGIDLRLPQASGFGRSLVPAGVRVRAFDGSWSSADFEDLPAVSDRRYAGIRGGRLGVYAVGDDHPIWEQPGGWANRGAFFARDALLATVALGGRVQVRDAATGERWLALPTEGELGVPEGDPPWIVVQHGAELAVWPVPARAPGRVDLDLPVRRLVTAPDGSWALAIGESDHAVWMDLATARTERWAVGPQCRDAAVAPDGTSIALACRGAIGLFGADGHPGASIAVPGVSLVAWPDPRRLVAIDRDGKGFEIDPVSGAVSGGVPRHVGPAWRLARDGATVISDGRNEADGAVVASGPDGEQRWKAATTGFGVARNGGVVALGTGTGQLWLRGPRDADWTRVAAHHGPVLGVDAAPGGFVTAGFDGALGWWAPDGAPVARATLSDEPLIDVSAVPGGPVVVADARGRVWVIPLDVPPAPAAVPVGEP